MSEESDNKTSVSNDFNFVTFDTQDNGVSVLANKVYLVLGFNDESSRVYYTVNETNYDSVNVQHPREEALELVRKALEP